MLEAVGVAWFQVCRADEGHTSPTAVRRGAGTSSRPWALRMSELQMTRRLVLVTALAAGVLAASCGNGETRADTLRAQALDAGLEPLRQMPYRGHPDLVSLGEALFFDPIVGGEFDVACGTCHHPTLGFGDGRDLPIGVAGVGLGPDRFYPDGANLRPLGELRPLGRHSPTIVNLRLAIAQAESRGQAATFTWDGRITALSVFAHTPLRTRDEMRGDSMQALDIVPEVLARIESIDEYRDRFARVFPETAATGIDDDHFAQAISAYMLSINSAPTAYDRFFLGEDAPNQQFLDGLELFLELDCVQCHNGVALTDFGFHRTGVEGNVLSRPFQGGVDIGREEATGRVADRFMFRTATLREVAHTAPYMHSGTLSTLEDVVRNYTDGRNPLETLDGYDGHPLERGSPRALSDDEVAALVALLEAMSSPDGWLETTYPAPLSVPSGLAPAAIEDLP